jgi:hypothetical protein
MGKPSETEVDAQSVVASPRYFDRSEDELVYIDGSIFWGGRAYAQQTGHIVAAAFSGIAGAGTDGRDVYTVGELAAEKWLGMLQNGTTILFKELSQPYLSLSEFQPTQITVRNANSNQKYSEITSKDTIDKIISDINDANLVVMPEGSLLSFIVEMVSDKYPGISFLYMMLHDSDGNCFVFDYANSEVWIAGHELASDIPDEYLSYGEQQGEGTDDNHSH